MEHKHTILYAEDDLDDLFMVEQAFEQFDGTVELIRAADGFETLEKLKRAEAGDALPCLIILDINMPAMDGRETLRRIRQLERFKDIPVILFSTSSSSVDRSFAESMGVQLTTKPLVYSELEELARTFLHLCTTAASEKA